MFWTDNPLRDADRYMDMMEAKDARCLHCIICGAQIADGMDYYEVNGDTYCEECMNDGFRKTYYEPEPYED